MKYDSIAEAYVSMLAQPLEEDVLDMKKLAAQNNIETLLGSKKIYEKKAALFHKDINDEHIQRLLKEPSMALRADVFFGEHSYITPKHIDAALDDSTHQVKIAAIRHPNASEQNISKALNDPDERVRVAALRSKSANNTHIDRGLSDKHLSVRQTAISRPNANVENITRALRDTHGSVRISAINHPNVDRSHIDIAIKDANLQVANDAVSHPLATKEQMLQAIPVKRHGSMSNKLTAFNKHPRFKEYFPTGKVE